MIALKVSKNLNSTTLEEILGSLRSHEIELEEDETLNKGNYVTRKTKRKSEKTNAFQDIKEKLEEDSDGEEEVSLLSKIINQLQKQRYKRSIGYIRLDGHSEKTFGQKKLGAERMVISFACKDFDQFNNNCPRLNRERPNQKFFKDKKSLMVTMTLNLQMMTLNKIKLTWC